MCGPGEHSCGADAGFAPRVWGCGVHLLLLTTDHLRVRDAAGPMARLPGALAGAGIAVERFRPIAPTMEDVFIERMEG